jgi:thioredoxin reductase (NADPH)
LNGSGPRRFCLTIGEDETATARAVVVASGARYRRLDGVDAAPFEGSSVHYWASPLEGKLCAGEEVVLVGAGNSAGQAAVYLATNARKVWMLVRGPSLSASMSSYLVERIAAQSNIEVLTGVEVSGLEGAAGALEAVTWRDRGSGEEHRQAVGHLFLFIGAEPNTGWLCDCEVAIDSKGFVCTGAGAGEGCLALETSMAGVFAIGDVRSGSVKRVAAGVGEGAQVVAALHAYLAKETQPAPAEARSA